MNLTTYIIDDEAHAIETIAEYIGRTPGLSLSGHSTDPLRALDVLNGVNPPQLAFVDVDMPGISGLELAGLVSGRTKVVFITSHREFGPEAFELNALDYLLKPISYARFLKCVQKILGSVTATNSNDLFVKAGLKGQLVKVPVPDIYYIQSSLHYVDIYWSAEKTTTYLTLAELESRLPASQFCRVHRSYIINMKKIKAVEQSGIRLENKELIPIGRGYRDSFFNQIAGLTLHT
jgi:DNA-binding LytR/AlgR family response regulator